MSEYEKIAREIKKKIMDGTFPADEKLPKQTELAALFQTSRVTIHRAFQILKTESFILTQKGVGSFAKKTESDHDVNIEEYIGLTKKMKPTSLVRSKIISFHLRFPDEREQEKLHLKKEEPVYDIIRLRLINEEPFVLEYTIMPIHVISMVSEEVLLNSIYEHIENTLHLTIGGAVRRIRADKPDAYDNKFLNCQNNIPVLEVEQIVSLDNGTPFEYSQSRYRSDHANFVYYSHTSKEIKHIEENHNYRLSPTS